MNEIESGKKILVGVDGSGPSRLALDWGLMEARARRTELVAAYAWRVPSFVFYAPGYVPIASDEMVEDGKKLLEKEIGKGLGDGEAVKVESRVVEGSASAVLRRIAEEPDVGLVVVGTRGHNAATAAVLGSVSHSLSHHCPKTLVIIHGTQGGSHVSPSLRHIVVGVDGSEGSDAALRWAADEAKLHGAVLEVVAAWSWTSVPPDVVLAVPPGESLELAARDVASNAIDRLHDGDLDVKLTTAEGPAPEVLLDLAESADLLVVGSRGHRRATEMILGSTSHLCAHRSAVPVAIVPSRGEIHD